MEIFFGATRPSGPQEYKKEKGLKFFLFDLDGTLAVSKKGERYAASTEDTLILPGVKAHIDALYERGYYVLIVTNQIKGLPKAPKHPITMRLSCVAGVLQVPLIAALGASRFRKPSPSMWVSFLSLAGIDPELIEELHYCGDAAGPDLDPAWPPYMYNNADSGFAQAIGAVYHLPRDVFNPPMGAALRHPALKEHQEVPKIVSDLLLEEPDRHTVCVMVGVPGCGKTGVAKAICSAANWEYVGQDECGTRGKTLQRLTESLAAKKSAVVDATHSSFERREEIYLRANLYDNVLLIILWVVREGRSFNDRREGKERVGEVVYSQYAKKFEDPRKDRSRCQLEKSKMRVVILF